MVTCKVALAVSIPPETFCFVSIFRYFGATRADTALKSPRFAPEASGPGFQKLEIRAYFPPILCRVFKLTYSEADRRRNLSTWSAGTFALRIEVELLL
jgi:hypothetical protein